MIGLIQLVSQAKVVVDNVSIAEINRGIVALVGLEKTDTRQSAQKLFSKLLSYRIFPDEEGKMNLSLKDVQGQLLLVPQFTLVAETQKGSRPGFSKGLAPDIGQHLFLYLVNYAKAQYRHVSAGQFGAHMQVTLCNDGPVTFILHI